MHRIHVLLVHMFLVMMGTMPVLASAQISEIDSGFSDQLVSELGYPLVEVTVGPGGIDAPTELAAGVYVVRLVATDDYIAYLNIVRPPAALTGQEEEEQMLLAGAMDLPQEGWTYFGGTNTFGIGEPASFVIELRESDYKIAASYYGIDGGAEEIMRLSPLAVTASASPVASDAVASPVVQGTEPPSTVTLEMTDELDYIVTPDPVPAGPQIWRVENTGTRKSHHTVISRVPDGTTADDVIAGFSGTMTGTPPAEDGLLAQMVGTGYAAMQSGGTVTWVEFDFEPGTYVIICYIMNDEQSMPHFMDGMVTVFTVE